MSFFDMMKDPRRMAGAELGLGLMQMGARRPVGSASPVSLMDLLRQYKQTRNALPPAPNVAPMTPGQIPGPVPMPNVPHPGGVAPYPGVPGMYPALPRPGYPGAQPFPQGNTPVLRMPGQNPMAGLNISPWGY